MKYHFLALVILLLTMPVSRCCHRQSYSDNASAYTSIKDSLEQCMEQYMKKYIDGIEPVNRTDSLSVQHIHDTDAHGKTLDFTCRISQKDFSGRVKSSICIILPDSSKSFIPCADDTTITIPLVIDGYYEIRCRFKSEEYGVDTISRKVLFNSNDVIHINVDLSYYKDRKDLHDRNCSDSVSCGMLRIQRILKADPDIKLSYSYYSLDKIYRGPLFTIENNSSYTVYGRYLPGYFWGEYAEIVDGKVGAFHPGIIDTEFVDKAPLYPGKTSDALIGSFGIWLSPGMYRFNLIYQKDSETFDASALLCQDRHHRWFYSMHDGYQISYDFEITKSDYKQ